MKVVFYLSKHAMPFSGKEINPYRLFDPEMMSNWIETTYYYENPKKEIPDILSDTSRVASEHPFWPMLLALAELERDDAMAHVNAVFGSNAFRFQERTVVRITSSVPYSDEYGIPVVQLTDTLDLLYEPDLPRIFSEHEKSELRSVGFWTEQFETALQTV